MSFDIKFSDEALLDLSETRGFYSKVSSELVLKFDAELIEIIERIQVNPEHFQKRYRTIKIVFTKKFPFGIHYLVGNNTIFIQRILHAKRFYK